jgi:hypothetical protein
MDIIQVTFPSRFIRPGQAMDLGIAIFVLRTILLQYKDENGTILIPKKHPFHRAVDDSYFKCEDLAQNLRHKISQWAQALTDKDTSENALENIIITLRQIKNMPDESILRPLLKPILQIGVHNATPETSSQ